MTWQETTETINGCRTRIMRGGRGAPLIYLHGAGGAPAWLPVMTGLAERYEVIVPEHPGFGGSDMPAWLDTVGDLAFFYLDFLRHFGLTNVHLVGTSLGGWVAAELAVRDCSQLATLTLVAPAGIRLVGVRKADLFMLSPEETIRHLFHSQSLIQAALERKLTDAELDMQMKNRFALAKLAWEPRLFNPHLHKWLHRISTPTLIVWGRNDRMIPAAYGPAFAGLIPGARLETIADCGHLPQVERPDVLVDKIARFIAESRK